VIKMVALFVAGLLVLLLAALAAAYWYSLSLPGEPYAGPPAPPTAAETDLAERMARHVKAIASEPHNVDHYPALERSAAYIEGELKALGYTPQSQVYEADGKSVRNISVELAPAGAPRETESLVIGAHYDSAGTAPGANDNGSGSAAVLELARLLKDVPLKNKRLRLVLFVNEEPPYDRTEAMGSYRYAKSLHDSGEKVLGMISLETIGSFSDEPHSQSYPFPFNHVFSDVGNFIAFVALPGGRAFLHDSIPGIGWSDHWSFWMLGYPAIMVTDTAPFRYRHYHRPTDTPDKVAYDKLARITLGLEAATRDLLR
jgi:hypothetical protein